MTEGGTVCCCGVCVCVLLLPQLDHGLLLWLLQRRLQSPVLVSLLLKGAATDVLPPACWKCNVPQTFLLLEASAATIISANFLLYRRLIYFCDYNILVPGGS